MILLLAITLFDQSTARLLETRFPQPKLSYLLTDAQTGSSVAERWVRADVPIPMGSLVKAFLVPDIPASAQFHCGGRSCWLQAGHGQMGLIEAIAHSCNEYFLAAARQLGSDASAATLIGLGENWKLTPHVVAERYRKLLSRPDAGPLRQGMRMAADKGTGRLARVKAWVKTGTAPCSHARRGAGDGLVVVADERLILTVRVHGTTGSQAAITAGDMWRAIHDAR